MHGDMDQKTRDCIMREFRTGSSRVLITTDLLVCTYLECGICVVDHQPIIGFFLLTFKFLYLISDIHLCLKAVLPPINNEAQKFIPTHCENSFGMNATKLLNLCQQKCTNNQRYSLNIFLGCFFKMISRGYTPPNINSSLQWIL